jgi:hypothetical protein
LPIAESTLQQSQVATRLGQEQKGGIECYFSDEQPDEVSKGRPLEKYVIPIETWQ